MSLNFNCNHCKTIGVNLKSDQPESIIEKCDRFRDEADKFYKCFEDEKSEQEAFYNGDHWKDKAPTNRPRNHIFQIVESEIPLLMDPMPATDILAHDEANFSEHAIVLDAAKDHVYRQQNILLKDAQMIRSALKTGSGFQYIDYDPDGENGEGSITVVPKPRKFVRKDPSADTIDDARYVIIDTPMSDDDLKRRFPETAKEALKQGKKSLFVFAGTKGSRENQNTGYGRSKDVNRYDSEDMTFVEEYWLKDYTMEAIPDEETQLQLTEESVQLQQGVNPDISKWEDHEAHLQGHEDQKNAILKVALESMGLATEMATQQDVDALKQDPKISLLINIIDDHIEMHHAYIESMDKEEIGKRPKYPNNLRLVIKTGKVIHFDGAPEVPDGMIPLVELECYKDEGPSEGIIKNLIPLQKTINEMDAKELKGLKLVTNPGWVVDLESGVDPDTLTDVDGIVVPKAQGTQVERLQPGVVSQQLENRSRRDYEAMQRIEGAGETVFGEAPKAQTSGVMYRRLQMQALGRIRLKTKMLEAAIYRRDLLITARIIKYWSTERKLRAEDANGKIQFIKFDPKMMKDFTYDLSFPAGTSAGVDNEQIAETYKEMLNNGQIDVRTFAILTNLPKKQELLEILDQQDQVKAELQNLTAQNQELQKQMLMMKANLAPGLVTPEEAKAVEQFAIQDQQAQLTSNPMAVE